MKPLASEPGPVPHADIPAYPAVIPGVDGDDPARRLHIALRADAGRTQGTGHVMRLLTLAESLLERGHRVTLVSAEIEIPWLAAAVRASGVERAASPRDDIDVGMIVALEVDAVVVDSYLVPAPAITALNELVPVLLLADGDARGAAASAFLDQNLAAPPLPGVPERLQLRGAEFALVRRAIRQSVPADPVPLRHDPPEVVVVLGGTDPDDRTIDVARACVLLESAAILFVAPERQHDELLALAAGRPGWRVLGPTPELPSLLAQADAIVSAGGTSAWDIATIGTPSVLLAVVENQRASLAAVVAEGVALGFDVVDGSPEPRVLAGAIESLLTDPRVRSGLSGASRRLFDGGGAARVVEELERLADRGMSRP